MTKFSFYLFDFIRFALLVLFRVKKYPPGWPVENSPTERKSTKSKDNLLFHSDISGSGREPRDFLVPSEEMFRTYPEYFLALRIDTRFSSLSKLNVPSSVQRSLDSYSGWSKNRHRVFNLSTMTLKSANLFCTALRADIYKLSKTTSFRSKRHLLSSSVPYPNRTFNFRYRINVCLLKLVRIIQNVLAGICGVLFELSQTRVRNPRSFLPKTDLLMMVNSSFRILFYFSKIPGDLLGATRSVVSDPDESLRTKVVLNSNLRL